MIKGILLSDHSSTPVHCQGTLVYCHQGEVHVLSQLLPRAGTVPRSNHLYPSVGMRTGIEQPKNSVLKPTGGRTTTG